MTPDEARAAVDRVKAAVTQAREDLVTLWRDRAWIALGYQTWEDLCDVEFGVRMALPREERPAIVADLREQGMTTRAIGSALGVGVATVQRDLARVPNGTPAPATVTGLDGKSYSPARPTLARRHPDPIEVPRPVVDEQVDVPVLSHPLVVDNPDRQAAEYRRNVIAAIERVFALRQFDAERVADLIEDEHARLIDEAAAGISEWAERVRRTRTGLRIVKGVQ